MHQTGLCGTDKHIHEGDFIAAFPLVPGHEIVGTVESTGAEVRDLEPGQWVTVNPNISCGGCDQCRRGRPLLCRNLTAVGVNRHGGFAEYVTVPAGTVFDVEGLDPDVTVLTEPTACALHGLERLAPPPGCTALVLGAGATGLLLAQLIAAGGAAHVTVASPNQAHLDRADALGRRRHRAGRLGPPRGERGDACTSAPAVASTASSRPPARRASAPAAWA